MHLRKNMEHGTAVKLLLRSFSLAARKETRGIGSVSPAVVENFICRDGKLL
jgi:hypothetical protein